MENEWIVVKATDKKRVMRTGRRGIRKPSSYTHGLDQPNSTKTLQSALKIATNFILSSDLWSNFLRDIKTVLLAGDVTIRALVCYGIGNFASTTTNTFIPAPMWQLAFLVCLQQHVSIDSNETLHASVYDPCFTPFEKDFLSSLDRMLVMEDNRRGNVRVDNAIFFMPHCPVSLYENVVWANWGCNALVVGNSLVDLADRRKNALCLQTIEPLLKTLQLRTTNDDERNAPGNILGAFNDTYLSKVDSSWPTRPYDSLMDATGDDELL